MRIPRSFIDTLHRGTVLFLVGISGFGLYMGYSVHKHTLDRGNAIMARLELEKLKSQQTAEQEEAWANAAQESLARKL